MKKQLPVGSAVRTDSSTVEGVTTARFFDRGGSEIELTIFKTVNGAKQAEAAEARIGDAHDRRVGNMLYTGGDDVARAVSSCR